MNLIAAVFKLGVQNNSTSPPTIDQEYRLRIVKANSYTEALEIIVKHEVQPHHVCDPIEFGLSLQ